MRCWRGLLDTQGVSDARLVFSFILILSRYESFGIAQSLINLYLRRNVHFMLAHPCRFRLVQLQPYIMQMGLHMPRDISNTGLAEVSLACDAPPAPLSPLYRCIKAFNYPLPMLLSRHLLLRHF